MDQWGQDKTDHMLDAGKYVLFLGAHTYHSSNVS